jgi:3-hydroxyacyl-CoA dehydrogenase
MTIRVVTVEDAATLATVLAEAEADEGVSAVVLAGPGEPLSGQRIDDVRELIALVERSTKTYVCAMEGGVRDRALELALVCDYRVSSVGTIFALSDIRRGLIPGAGGTQRLPRLIGVQVALKLMLTGDDLSAEDARKIGLIDEVVSEDAAGAAAASIPRFCAVAPKRRVSGQTVDLGIGGAGLFAAPFAFAEAHKAAPAGHDGGTSAHKLIDAVEAAVELDFARGLARERRIYDELETAGESSVAHV